MSSLSITQSFNHPKPELTFNQEGLHYQHSHPKQVTYSLEMKLKIADCANHLFQTAQYFHEPFMPGFNESFK